MNVLTEQFVINTLADMAEFYIFILESLQIFLEHLQFRRVDLPIAIAVKEGEDLHRTCQELGRVWLAADGLRVECDQTKRCNCVTLLLAVQADPWIIVTEGELMAEVALHIAASSRPFEKTEAKALCVGGDNVNETTI